MSSSESRRIRRSIGTPNATVVSSETAAESYRARHYPLLGTVLEVRIDGVCQEHATLVDQIVVDEVSRLERVFSAYDEASELERWKRGAVEDPSPDFRELMASALCWQIRSGGAYNPAVGVVSIAWREAAARHELPSQATLTELATAIRTPRYWIDDSGRPVPAGDCSALNLNALAKGWIVDRAVNAAVARFPTLSLLVNAGGDLTHRGGDAVPVGIENPLRQYDNQPPIAQVAIANAGLATSGRARHGFRIGGRLYSHVIDPRTARTADQIASISVVAADAATADVVATIAGLLDPPEAIDYATQLDLACLVVDPTGACHSNSRWKALEQLT